VQQTTKTLTDAPEQQSGNSAQLDCSAGASVSLETVCMNESINHHDPAIARRKRIEELKRELSELSSKDEAKRSEIGGMA